MSLFNLNPKEFPRELFGREKELDELVCLVKARRWIAIMGPRMVGKTSRRLQARASSSFNKEIQGPRAIQARKNKF